VSQGGEVEHRIGAKVLDLGPDAVISTAGCTPWATASSHREDIGWPRRSRPAACSVTIIEGHEVDFAWPTNRLIIELDSWEFHKTRADFENDRRKDRHLTAAFAAELAAFF
jgi:hypothetical protein